MFAYDFSNRADYGHLGVTTPYVGQGQNASRLSILDVVCCHNELVNSKIMQLPTPWQLCVSGDICMFRLCGEVFNEYYKRWVKSTI